MINVLGTPQNQENKAQMKRRQTKTHTMLEGNKKFIVKTKNIVVYKMKKLR